MDETDRTDEYQGRPDGGGESNSHSDSQDTQIIPEEVYLNRVGDLAGFVLRTRKRKAQSPSPELVSYLTFPQPDDNMDDGPSQKLTQPVDDPRRFGKNVSDVSDSDLSDVICILHPSSSAAIEAVQATMQAAPQHILQNGDLGDLIQDDINKNVDYSERPREIALRISSNVKKPASGFTFGRNRQTSDILLVMDEGDKKVSNVHFKIYVNSHGSLMIEDTSTNGTLVDDEHLRYKDRDGRLMKTPATRALRGGALICVVGANNAEIKLLVRIPNRGDYEDLYEEKLRKYLAARGQVANFASMRENTYGNYWNGGLKYNFTGLLGKGAFATVYRVQTKKEGTYFAAKEIDKRRFIKNGILDLKFDSELKIMQGLRHPNIVQYIDHHEHDQWIYILMEYVPYGELSKELADNGAMPEPLVQSITRQILHALNYLHQRDITHRDIKPDNILISSRNPLTVKLSDFGLSKSVKNDDTFLKTFCGTLLYCAPEIYPDYTKYQHGLRPKRRRVGDPAPRTSPYDQSVDMWSFGAVLFHILCGRAPIMGRGDDKGAQMLHNIMTKDIDFTPLLAQGISDAATDFIGKLMNRNPSLRPREVECFQHMWIRGVKDIFDYKEENQVAAKFSQSLGVVQEVEEDEFDDEENFVFQAVRELDQTSLMPPPIPPSSDRRAPKRVRRQAPDDETIPETLAYPSLPQLEYDGPVPTSSPATGQRLFGEVTPSIIRSSGVFGYMSPTSNEVREVQNRVEHISVNDFVTRSGSDDLMTSNQGYAASLFGAEAQIGQLNMASPGNAGFSENVSTPDTTNPITPQARDGSPSGVLTQSEEDDVSESYVDEGSPARLLGSQPKFSRHIDFALLTNNAAFTASLEAREASRAQKQQERASTFHVQPRSTDMNKTRVDPIELARTIDARTGRSVEEGSVFPKSDRTIRLEGRLSTGTHGPSVHGNSPTTVERFGTLLTLPGSIADLSIDITSRLTSWGRGLDCTVPYADKKDVRVPKYAIKLTFWAPEMEKFIERGGDWRRMLGIHTIISTSASQCIWVNDVELRKETARGDAALFGKVYDGDIVTIFKNSDPAGPFLKLKLGILFGDGARPRPKNEAGFQIQQERRYHQRVMKERDSMRLTGSDLGRTHGAEFAAAASM